MKITDVRIFRTKGKNNKSSLLAFASITISDEFVVGGFRIVDGSKGIFVAMPSQLGADDEYHDSAYPITKEAREEIVDAIMEAFEEDTDGEKDEAPKKTKSRSRGRK